MPRYYFYLTDGFELIPDEDGIELADISSALIQARKAVEEIRNEDPSAASEWDGWALEVADSSGRVVRTIPLEGQTDLWREERGSSAETHQPLLS